MHYGTILEFSSESVDADAGIVSCVVTGAGCAVAVGDTGMAAGLKKSDGEKKTDRQVWAPSRLR